MLRWFLIAAVVTGAAAFAYTRQTEKSAEFIYTTVPLSRGPLVARVTATGTLTALVTVQVGSQVSGRIQSLHADFNSKVSRGEVIARLDPQLFEANVEQAQANLTAAEGNLARARALATDAERQAQRAQEIYAQKLISQAERDTTQANAESTRASVASAEGAVAQAKASLNQAKINLAYTVIRSPTNGVVISRNVDVGQTVAAALQAPTLFTIAEDLRKMQVHTSVAESDVGRLTENMAASFTVDAYPGERFHGVVSQVRNAPQTVQNVVTYDAVIDVDNADLRLKPGLTANVNFIYAKRENALLLLNSALRFRPSSELAQKAGVTLPKRGDGPSSKRTLWVLRSEQPQPVQVELGVSDGTRSEIVSGEIHEDDPVITEMSDGKPKPIQPPMGRMF